MNADRYTINFGVKFELGLDDVEKYLKGFEEKLKSSK